MYRLKFVPFSSAMELSFWVQYNRLKLETIQLSEAPIDIHASYYESSSNNSSSSRMQCHEHSLNSVTTTTNERCRSRGILLGYNTVESFQTVDKNVLLRNLFQQLFFSDKDEDVISSLNMFVLITFGDLKHHKVVYWFGFPAALPATHLESLEAPRLLTDVYTPAVALDLAHQFHALRQQQQQQQQSMHSSSLPPYFIWMPQAQTCVALSKAAVIEANNEQQQQLVFGFLDPNHTTQDPGWPLRNLIAYLAYHLNLGGQTVRILSYRPGHVRRLTSSSSSNATADDTMELDQVHNTSLILDITIPSQQDFWTATTTSTTDEQSPPQLKVAGWEVNTRGKAGPRQVDLRPLLDAHHLAVQAADLNLKLMKWRMIPDLQVHKLQHTRVLLLGAGTLGCNVARTCLGWGFRHFTFVDYGTVQYSNPVRQPLFTLADCTAGPLGGGLPKAVAAAQALKLIAPDVDAKGIVLSIPMPGHAESKESIQTAVETLSTLIQQADVVFLGTDTRESRWLPTVMTAAQPDKILINAALGLDSWLVMRHGHSYGNSTTDDNLSPAGRLGCYFCNDVVAPENSQKNRTLDQQCTVTRPGLAPIASSMAVELLVALLHHPQTAAAPAPHPNRSSHFAPTLLQQDSNKDASSSSALGLLPHQIRGSLVTYTLMTPSVPAFVHCTACAPAVIDAYRQHPVDMVYETCACPTSQYLEDLAGLTEFRAQTEAHMQDDHVVGWDDDDDDGLEEEEA